jgi:hypothetical protein
MAVLKCCSETGGDIAAAQGLLLGFNDRIELSVSLNSFDANLFALP